MQSYKKVDAPQAILFDWSGTLSSDDLNIHAELAHRILKEMGYRMIPTFHKNFLHQIRQMVQAQYAEFLVLYNKELGNSSLINFLIADYAVEMLSLFKQHGIYLAIVSNRNAANLRREVELVNLSQYFNKIVGHDDTTMLKPSPVPIFAALGDIEPNNQVFFIGDSETDVECAKNAGCLPIIYGESMEKYKNVLSFASFKEFSGFVINLL